MLKIYDKRNTSLCTTCIYFISTSSDRQEYRRCAEGVPLRTGEVVARCSAYEVKDDNPKLHEMRRTAWYLGVDKVGKPGFAKKPENTRFDSTGFIDLDELRKRRKL